MKKISIIILISCLFSSVVFAKETNTNTNINSMNNIDKSTDLNIKSLIETYNLNGKSNSTPNINSNNNNLNLKDTNSNSRNDSNSNSKDNINNNEPNDNFGVSNSNTIINKIMETNKIIKNIESSNNKDKKVNVIQPENKSFYNANNDFINQANLDSIVKVQVKNIVSNEKESVGSGFFISKDGDIISNYHVISGHIKNPNITKIVVSIGTDPKEYEVKIKNVDVLNDLSLLKLNLNPLNPVTFNINTLDKDDVTLGTKVFSVGFPNNWRLTVSDGLLNGFFDKRIIKNYLVSYPLTPGMSGGPTYNKKGKVIGINVATSNALSMIIPAKSTSNLLNPKNWLSNDIKSENVRVDELKNKIFSQITAYNDVVLDQLNNAQLESFNNINLNLKTDFLECWSKQRTKADNDNDKIKRYTNITYICGNEDSIFYNEDTSFGSYYFMINYYQQTPVSLSSESSIFDKAKNWANNYYFHQVNEKLFNALIVANQKSIEYDNDEGCLFLNNNKLFVCKNSINIFKDNNAKHKLYQIKAVMFNNVKGESSVNNFIYNGFTAKQVVKFVNYLENLDNK